MDPAVLKSLLHIIAPFITAEDMSDVTFTGRILENRIIVSNHQLIEYLNYLYTMLEMVKNCC